MRIPLKVSAKGMKGHDRTKNDFVPVIFVSIFGLSFAFLAEEVVFILSFVFPVFSVIKKTGKGVSGIDKEIVEKDTIFNKILPHFPGDGKNNMTMFSFKSHGGNKGGTLFGFLSATLSTEMGMAGMSDHGFFTAPRALKEITAKINGMTEDSFLNIIKSNRTKFTDIKEMSKIVIVIKKDKRKGSFLFRMIMMSKVK